MYNISRAYPTGTDIINPNPFYGFPLAPATRWDVSRDTTAANIAEVGYKQNDLVFSLVTIRATAIQQAPIVVFDEKDETETPITDCPLIELLQNPNPLFDEPALQSITDIYGCIGSDAYQYKVRDNYMQPIQLYPYHSSQIQPIQGNYHWVECYRYNNGAGYIIDLPVEDVIQFRWNSIDFNRPYRSIGALVAGANDVDIDNDRAQMAKALLQNGAVPAFLVELAENVTIPDANGVYRPPTQEQLERLGERLQERFGTKNRGKGGFMPFGSKVHKLGFSPKEMSTTDFVFIPETRLSTIFGVPIQITSFYAGKDMKTYANYEQARKSFYEDTMIPRWMSFGRRYTKEFSYEMFPGDKRKYKVKYDISKVRALQDSQDILQDRAQDEFEKGISTLNEVRERMGREEDQTYGEQYYWELTGKTPPEEKDLNEELSARIMENVQKTGRGKIHSSDRKRILV